MSEQESALLLPVSCLATRSVRGMFGVASASETRASRESARNIMATNKGRAKCTKPNVSRLRSDFIHHVKTPARTSSQSHLAVWLAKHLRRVGIPVKDPKRAYASVGGPERS